MRHSPLEIISPETAWSLDGLMHERARLSGNRAAYRYFDDNAGDWRDYTWSQMVEHIAQWQAAFKQENLQAGDRVAIMLKNCPEWVMFDQAALGLGLVTVPLYITDRPENVAYILKDAGVKFLLLDSVAHWQALRAACDGVDTLHRVVALKMGNTDFDEKLRTAHAWLPSKTEEMSFEHHVADPHQLASIIYTSGTTGRSKGVMLSHYNMLTNAWGCVHACDVGPDTVGCSLLPLSHTFERTVGYYTQIVLGAMVAYSRPASQLEDFAAIRPNLLLCVPRLFERIYSRICNQLEKKPAYHRWLFNLTVDVGFHRFERQQKRAQWHPKLLLWPLLKYLVADKIMAKLGGNLRRAVSGGAALSPDISKIFIALGLPIIQGYGLTETSPVVCVNRENSNIPASVGQTIPGVSVRVSAQGELQVKGPNLMLGYWNNPQATAAMFTEDGWLNTGDVARIDERGHIYITGRIKEIIVLSNGEKVPPVDMEAAIMRDPLFEQVIVVGEGKSHLGAMAVINQEQWINLSNVHQLDTPWPDVLNSPKAHSFVLHRVGKQIAGFPGYAKIRRTALLKEPWTSDNGLLTPTLKAKRNVIQQKYQREYEQLWEL